MNILVKDIQFLEEFYPRDSFDNEIVNSYRLNIDNLPPIIISKENILIDGYHRLIAHRLEKKEEIGIEILDIPKERILFEATKLNSKHGLQLSKKEKRRLSQRFYQNGIKIQEIASVLSVSSGIVSEWLSDLIQDIKKEQEKQIIDLHLKCLTNIEIGSKVGLSDVRVGQILNNFISENTSKISQNPPESLQLFNVWNFGKREGLEFRGAIPHEIIENVLWYYTKPFDLVVDPMVGSGTTKDVCKKMHRRYLVYDLNPITDDIQKNDINNGFPKECKDCDLIFLDPPYFNMVFEGLFKDIDDFYSFIEKLAKNSYKTVKKDGIVALLIEDMTEKGNYCLSGESYRIFIENKFQCINHISCPLSTQQFNPQQMEKAKETRHLLGRNRDLWVFKK